MAHCRKATARKRTMRSTSMPRTMSEVKQCRQSVLKFQKGKINHHRLKRRNIMNDQYPIKTTQEKISNKKRSKLMQKVQSHSKKIEDKFRTKYNASAQKDKKSENENKVKDFDDDEDIEPNQASYEFHSIIFLYTLYPNTIKQRKQYGGR